MVTEAILPILWAKNKIRLKKGTVMPNTFSEILYKQKYICIFMQHCANITKYWNSTTPTYNLQPSHAQTSKISLITLGIELDTSYLVSTKYYVYIFLKIPSPCNAQINGSFFYRKLLPFFLIKTCSPFRLLKYIFFQ